MLEWIRDRTGWTDLRSALGARSAPRRGYMYYLGSLTLFLLFVEVASGILLLLHYQPDVEHAHASVERIRGQLPSGDLIRGVHLWAGDLFVAFLVAHLFTVLVRRSYRPSHELTWLSGQVALVLGIGLAFTGAILPWSRRAFAQARMGSQLAGYVPVVGHWLGWFMRGGDEVGPSTLAHAFGFHVAVLPAGLTLLIGAHLFFLTRKPVLPDGPTGRGRIPLYPHFLARQAVAWTLVLAATMTLAIFVDRPLGPAADPRLPSIGAQPPWYFLPVHQLVVLSPRDLLGVDGARFLVGVGCLVGLVAVALPFLDRDRSRVTVWVAWIALLLVLLLAASAYV